MEKQDRKGPRGGGKSERSDPGVVADGSYFSDRHPGRLHWVIDSLWLNFFSGLARIHHPYPDPACRSSNPLLGFFRGHAVAVYSDRHSLVGLFTILIPVYAYLLVPIRSVFAGDCKDFLARTAKIQWGLMVCVYFVSYAPALLSLKIPGYERQNANLLIFLVAVVQLSDVLQYICGKCFGRLPIAPKISPNKTIEGFVGGVAGAVLIGTLLWWLTPFRPWQSAVLSLIIALMGFCGGLVMSAIKRDRGVKDYGSMIPGHGGMMDRIDSLCFAAPVFFHLTRYYFT